MHYACFSMYVHVYNYVKTGFATFDNIIPIQYNYVSEILHYYTILLVVYMHLCTAYCHSA